MSELLAQQRTALRKKNVGKLREEGILPAEMYGGDDPNMHLAVKGIDLKKLYKVAGRNTVVSVVVDGKKYPILIQSVQKDPVSGDIIAADFYRVNMKEKIATTVPLVFVNDAPAVKDGAMLTKAMQEVEVEALPNDLPHEIEIDLSVLKAIGDSIYVRDLKMSKTYEILTDEDTVIASVSEQVEEKEEVMTPDQVVVEGEEKKAARAEEAGAEAQGK